MIASKGPPVQRNYLSIWIMKPTLIVALGRPRYAAFLYPGKLVKERSIGTELPRPGSGTYMASGRISFEELRHVYLRNMSSNTPDYIYPIIVPSDSNVEDAFSSTTTPDCTPASPDYSPASPGNTSHDPSDDLSMYLLASLAISSFYDDPYMKVMQAYNATSNK
ncbi:hypothetical protein Tco_0133829 [Tanacetum coccineum]